MNYHQQYVKLCNEKKIDVNKVQGTGKDGRILKGDLIRINGPISTAF